MINKFKGMDIYIFDDIIDITNFDPGKIKIDEKSGKYILIY